MVEAVELHLVSQDRWLEYECEVCKQEGLTPDEVEQVKEIEGEAWKLGSSTSSQSAKIEHKNRESTRISTAIRASQMVMEFHNRHIGLTYGVAYTLTRCLQSPCLPHDAPAPWREVLVRLNQELESEKPSSWRTRRQIRPTGRILLNGAPLYVLYRLVMPLVQLVSARIGLCYLAAAGSVSTQCPVEALLQHDQNMAHKIAQMASVRGDPELELFWIDRAITLATFSKSFRDQKLVRVSAAEGAVTEHAYMKSLRHQQLLPDPPPLSAALFYRLDALPEGLHEYETLQRVPRRYRQERIRWLREEGVSGITLSRSPDDIGQIRQSEMLYPPVLRADRLLNTGYLITEREPKRQKLRDVLIVGMLPPQAGDPGSRAFVKTCWFNTLVILSQILFRHRLFDSEFWWLEGSNRERYSTAVARLEELKTELKPSNQIRVIGRPEFRRVFLNLIHWQPAFLDPDRHWLRSHTEASNKHRPSINWVLSMAHKERLAISKHEPDRRESWTDATLMEMVREYAMVHFAAFLPNELLAQNEDEKDIWGQGIGAGLKARLRLFSSLQHNLSVSWVTAANENHRSVPISRYLGRFYREHYAWNREVPEGNLRVLASKLEKIWLDEIVKEMQIDV